MVHNHPRLPLLFPVLAIGFLLDATSSVSFHFTKDTSHSFHSDSTSARTLAITVGTDGGVDVESCTDACFNAGYPISGLEFADQCCMLHSYWMFLYALISVWKSAVSNLTMEARP